MLRFTLPYNVTVEKKLYWSKRTCKSLQYIENNAIVESALSCRLTRKDNRSPINRGKSEAPKAGGGHVTVTRCKN